MSTGNDEVDFYLEEEDFESNKSKLQAGLKILSESGKEDASTYFSTSKPSDIFAYIYSFTNSNYGKDDVLETCEFFLLHDFHLILIKLAEYFNQVCETLKKPYSAVSDEEVNKAMIFQYTQFISNYLFAYSMNFRLKYFANGGLKYLLEIINNDKFTREYFDERVLEFIVMNINQLSKDADLYKAEWSELKAVDILMRLAKKNHHCKLHAYSAFSNVATDMQINTLSEIQDMIPQFVKHIIKAANELNAAGQATVEREKIQFNEEDEAMSQQYDVYHVADDVDVNLKRSLTGLLNTLYRLSVNDKIKYDIFVKYNAQHALKILIKKGVDIEKKYALKLLAQLCFDAQVVDIVSKDDDLIKYIESLSNNLNCSIKSLPKVCKQVLWSLKMKNTMKQPQQQQQNKEATIQNQKSQIMISYNSASRDLCLKLKTELEKAGYKIWIDIDEIHGSSLDSMARAVETSEVILVSVTEKYRQSINCQAEAQYAFKLKKPIIPLIMQKDYESVGGWLGMIMGDRIYINFIKYAFEEAVKRLLSQIVLVTGVGAALASADDTTTGPVIRVENSVTLSTAAAAPMSKKDDIVKWSEKQVEDWFTQNGHSAIYNKIKPCDGELLYQLHKMYLNAPEFFYQSISVDKTYELRKILVFTKQFEKLFIE